MASTETEEARSSRLLVDAAKATPDDLYALLALPSPNTSDPSDPAKPALDGKALTRAWRKAALIHHPDKNPGNEVAAAARYDACRTAFNILSDAGARAAYDDRQRATHAKHARDAAFEGKRRRMKEDLEAREAVARSSNARSGANTNTHFKPAAPEPQTQPRPTGYASGMPSTYPPNKPRAWPPADMPSRGQEPRSGGPTTFPPGSWEASLGMSVEQEAEYWRIAEKGRRAVQDRNEQTRKSRQRQSLDTDIDPSTESVQMSQNLGSQASMQSGLSTRVHGSRLDGDAASIFRTKVLQRCRQAQVDREALMA